MKRLLSLLSAVILLISGCSKNGSLPGSPPSYSKSSADMSGGPSGKSFPDGSGGVGDNQTAGTGTGKSFASTSGAIGSNQPATPGTSVTFTTVSNPGGNPTSTAVPTGTTAPTLPDSWLSFGSEYVDDLQVKTVNVNGEFDVIGYDRNYQLITVTFKERPTQTKSYPTKMYSSAGQPADTASLFFDAERDGRYRNATGSPVNVTINASYTRVDFNSLRVYIGLDSIHPSRLSGRLYFK